MKALSDFEFLALFPDPQTWQAIGRSLVFTFGALGLAVPLAFLQRRVRRLGAARTAPADDPACAMGDGPIVVALTLEMDLSALSRRPLRQHPCRIRHSAREPSVGSGLGNADGHCGGGLADIRLRGDHPLGRPGQIPKTSIAPPRSTDCPGWRGLRGSPCPSSPLRS